MQSYVEGRQRINQGRCLLLSPQFAARVTTSNSSATLEAGNRSIIPDREDTPPASAAIVRKAARSTNARRERPYDRLWPKKRSSEKFTKTPCSSRAGDLNMRFNFNQSFENGRDVGRGDG